MHESFRPTVEQWNLFCDVCDYVVANRKAFQESQAYLARTYSMDAIRLRSRREDEQFMGKELALLHRKPPDGWKKRRHSRLNTAYLRIMQFVGDQGRIDLSSMHDGQRNIWARRIIYVSLLMTDPDCGERGLSDDGLLGTPWDDRHRLGRWWCREAVFSGPGSSAWMDLIRMAMEVVSRRAPKRTRKKSWFPLALMIVKDHPDWPDSKIAAEVGINPSALSRSPEYQNAAKIWRASGARILKGRVVVDPDTGLHDVEAESDIQEQADAKYEQGYTEPRAQG